MSLALIKTYLVEDFNQLAADFHCWDIKVANQFYFVQLPKDGTGSHHIIKGRYHQYDSAATWISFANIEQVCDYLAIFNPPKFTSYSYKFNLVKI